MIKLEILQGELLQTFLYDRLQNSGEREGGKVTDAGPQLLNHPGNVTSDIIIFLILCLSFYRKIFTKIQDKILKLSLQEPFCTGARQILAMFH